MWGEIAFTFQSGNFYMLTIAILAFIAFVIVVERFIMLHFVFNINFPKFLDNLKKIVTAKDFDRAINLCKSIRKTAMPKIALRALEAAETDPTTIRGTLEEETIEFLPRIESRLAILPAVATLVMLVGVLGTIDSLWDAFHSINILDTAKKQASLARGVAVSLNPTALALIVCMLVLAMHQVLKSSAVRLTEKMHYGIAVLHNLLVPQDVPTVIAAPAGASERLAPVDEDYTDATDDGGADEGISTDDAFEDASIEDIKDEEEII